MFQYDQIIDKWAGPFRSLTMNVLYLADELSATKKEAKKGDETLKKLLTKEATSDTQAALDEVDEDTQVRQPIKSFIEANIGRQINKAT